MRIVALFWLSVILEQNAGQIVDIGGVWEVKCPQGCSCQYSKFSDLPLHRWINTSVTSQNSGPPRDDGYGGAAHPVAAAELLKVATCVVSENPERLLSKLPFDVQVFTILESGDGSEEIVLSAAELQRFTELISLDVQGGDYPESRVERRRGKGGIILSADALLPLGVTLLYLNLERVTLSSLGPVVKNKVNLVVEPANGPGDEDPEDSGSRLNAANRTGHRLIFLSQQNGGENVFKEILPYDVYKQEVEGNWDIGGGLFAGLSTLTHLRVYDCALEDISWHMFDGLRSLVHLSLERNDLRVIPEFCFYGTPNLRTLSLAENQLLQLKSVDLAGLLMLEELDLRGNNLTFLSELSFPPFPALVSADFRDNPLESVFPSTFEIMNTTVRLHLGGDGARLKLQKNAFLGLRRLEMLRLYNLDTPVLERFVLQGMPMLLELRMRGNVSSIDFDAFLDLKQLLDLDLSHCHIQRISMDAFYGLERVRRIDLSHNDLEYVPPGLFALQQQRELKEIILSKNRLTTLPWDFFRNLRAPGRQPRIQNLRLDGNPWDCTCAMSHWNPNLVNRSKETAPRCLTPKRLQNWGVFHALRKGGLQCRRPGRRYQQHTSQRFASAANFEDSNSIG